ncbi:RNA-binding S4 domain-containing protein [Lutibaculum baratangense]|uniref:Ribosome-associated heat shock protein n=1 Tax=Lutibaculum baratangense AMV1 TaxID=631454 RepID=V4TCU1_9HYPH|nr:S4 domain-containing protein [Lutibaculum baratangense]ESR24118.1 Ribosome-associated heat shock protein [Lutibaculum baratangense AMV1]
MAEAAGSAGGQRLDLWLWHARVARTRSACAALVAGGKVRVNGLRVEKPARPVRAGDVVTLSVGGARVIKVLGFAERRGSPADARLLYEELSGPEAT